MLYGHHTAQGIVQLYYDIKRMVSFNFVLIWENLNACTIKDFIASPKLKILWTVWIGAVWFTVLDLKSGYCQVEMDEASKPLTAFTVGPLGFYECDHMLFGLVNALATFQRLMETCLADLQLNWCLIYLSDMVVFSKMLKEHLLQLRTWTEIETQQMWVF